MAKIVANILFGLMVALYPLAVYFGIQKFSIQHVSIFVLSLIILKFLFQDNKNKQQILLLISACALIIFTLISQNDIGIRLYPVLVNFSLLAIFAISLKYPPTFIEKLARLTTPELPESGVQYTKKVTKVWCAFFIFNGSVAGYTALFSSIENWALYNGLISYLLMGLIFAVEFIVRQKVKRDNA